MNLTLNGVELECHFFYTPAEPENGVKEDVELTVAYTGNVDIYDLLSPEQIAELEGMALCFSQS
jgi:hypothetical protein